MHFIGQFYTKWLNHFNNDLKEIEVGKPVVKNTDYEQQCRFFVDEDTNELFAYENEYCEKKFSKNNLDHIIVEHDMVRNKVRFVNYDTYTEYVPKSENESNSIFKKNLELINLLNKESYYKFLAVMDLKDKLYKEKLEPEEKYVINEYIDILDSHVEAGDKFIIEKMAELRMLYELRKESKNE